MHPFASDPTIRIISSGRIPEFEDYSALPVDEISFPIPGAPLTPRRRPASVALASLLKDPSLMAEAPSDYTDEPLSLVYLHCRYHADPRTPVLQHLLNTLQHNGPAHALRIGNNDELVDSLIFVRALLRRVSFVLLLFDLRDPGRSADDLQHFQLLTRSEIGLGDTPLILPSPVSSFTSTSKVA